VSKGYSLDQKSSLSGLYSPESSQNAELVKAPAI